MAPQPRYALQHAKAKALFIDNRGGMSMAAIAKEVGIKDEETIKAWATEENWKSLVPAVGPTNTELYAKVSQQLDKLQCAIDEGLGYPTKDQAATQKSLIETRDKLSVAMPPELLIEAMTLYGQFLTSVAPKDFIERHEQNARRFIAQHIKANEA